MESNYILDYILPAVLAILMFGIGTTLTWDDFRRILVYPKAVALGLIGQIVVLPALAVAIAIGFDMRPELAVGLILLSSCPGGPMSNLYSHLARGDTALSVTLTTLSTFITVVTIPLLTGYALDHFAGDEAVVRLSFFQTFIRIFAVALGPVIVGMFVRARWVAFARRIQRPFTIATTIAVALAIAAAIFSKRHEIFDLLGQAGGAAITLYLSSTFAGYLLARLGKLNLAQRKCIAIEVGFQNALLAITIAASMLKSPTITITPAVYSLVGVILVSILVIPMSRWYEM